MPSVIESPSCRVLEKDPRWDLMGTKACGGGKEFLWVLILVWEYFGIYRGGVRVRGLLRGPQARGAPLGRALRACGLLGTPLALSQVLWVSFGPRKIIAKVLFRLDSV